MKLLGLGDVGVDVLRQTCLSERFYEFCPQKEDYFLNFYINWSKVRSKVFVFKVGRIRFHIPTGFYIFVGSADGTTDWMLIDEVVDRNIEAFVTPTSIGSWSLQELELIDYVDMTYFYPDTRNPVPLVDESERYCVIVSAADQYHKFKNKDHGTLFVM